MGKRGARVPEKPLSREKKLSLWEHCGAPCARAKEPALRATVLGMLAGSWLERQDKSLMLAVGLIRDTFQAFPKAPFPPLARVYV